MITYPRLNQIGFFAEGEGAALFRGLRVSNYREPCATLVDETSEGGLHGADSIFADAKEIQIEEGCFAIKNTQVTRDPSRMGLTMLRAEFPLKQESKISSARLYITSRGIYDCKINGQRVTEHLLTPGLTQYDRRLNYQTYDITEAVSCGKSAAVGVTLGSGWWSGAQTFTVKNVNYFGDRESLLAKVVIRYEDGSEEIHVTDPATWKCSMDGAYRFAGYFAGEFYDARRADVDRDYACAGFDDSNWMEPEVLAPVYIPEVDVFPKGFGRPWPAVHEEEPILIGEYDAPVKIVEKREAQSVTQLSEGVWLYDFGQEMAGVPRVRLKEARGACVTFRFAEMLYPDLPEYEGRIGTLLLENYRDATSTDQYICAGGEEVYQPRFTFHGYRYLEISGVTEAPALADVVSLQYSSISDFAGSFSSSNALLNRFAENVRWSQKCNFISIPTDCPQRNERMGWAGDTHVFCHTAVTNAHLRMFYERVLQAMSDLQTKEGRYPEIAPLGGGFGGITYECASMFIAEELYCQYGDLRVIERYYPGMIRYMDYMEASGLPGEGDPLMVGPLGDWLAPEETDLRLLWNAFYYREAFLMQKFAALLGKEADQQRFSGLADRIRTFWNQKFVDPKNGKTLRFDGCECDTQTSYVLAIAYGLAEHPAVLAEHLARKCRENGHKVGTGFFGTGLLNQTLTDMGYLEDAYRAMLQTQCPSWLYPVTQGATTIWERWNSFTKEHGFGGQNSMNSFNHYSLGSVLSWMYSTILGIVREDDHPGYRHFTFCPKIRTETQDADTGLTFASGSVSTPYGVIRAGWKQEADQIRIHVEIPANVTATAILPDGRTEEVGSGKWKWSVPLS